MFYCFWSLVQRALVIQLSALNECLLLVIGIDIACRWFCGWRTLWYLFPVITQVLFFVCLSACFNVFAGKSLKLAFSVGCNTPDWHIFKMASCCTLTCAPLQSWQCLSQLCKGADNGLICCTLNIYHYPSVCMWSGWSLRINRAFCFSQHCCRFTCKRCQYIEVTVFISGIMEELHSLDPRRQELLEARFMGGVSGNTGGSTGSTSGGTKVSQHLLMDRLLLLSLSTLCLKMFVFFAGFD